MNICSPSGGRFVEVAVDGRFTDRRATLTYRVPDVFRGDIDIGQLVWVPVRRDLELGIVVEWATPDRSTRYRIRELHAPVEPAFRMSDIQWRLATWLAEETLCSLFEAASPMLPPGVGSRTVEYLELVRAPTDEERAQLTSMQARLIERLEANQAMTLAAARRAMDSSLTSIVPALEEKGLLRRIARVRHRQPGDDPGPQVVRLLDGGEPPPERAFRQLEAYRW